MENSTKKIFYEIRNPTILDVKGYKRGDMWVNCVTLKTYRLKTIKEDRSRWILYDDLSV